MAARRRCGAPPQRWTPRRPPQRRRGRLASPAAGRWGLCWLPSRQPRPPGKVAPWPLLERVRPRPETTGPWEGRSASSSGRARQSPRCRGRPRLPRERRQRRQTTCCRGCISGLGSRAPQLGATSCYRCQLPCYPPALPPWPRRRRAHATWRWPRPAARGRGRVALGRARAAASLGTPPQPLPGSAAAALRGRVLRPCGRLRSPLRHTMPRGRGRPPPPLG